MTWETIAVALSIAGAPAAFFIFFLLVLDFIYDRED